MILWLINQIINDLYCYVSIVVQEHLNVFIPNLFQCSSEYLQVRCFILLNLGASPLIIINIVIVIVIQLIHAMRLRDTSNKFFWEG